MTTLCRAYETGDAARAAVARLLATQIAEVRVVMGEPSHDHRAGSFAGVAGDRVGAFAGTAGEAMGSFAGVASERRGSFGDLDRETVMTYRDGIAHIEVASHHDLQRLLEDAGLDAVTAAVDVAALHAGRVLVLVRTGAPEPAVAALDA
jgi:hypothetical protein